MLTPCQSKSCPKNKNFKKCKIKMTSKKYWNWNKISVKWLNSVETAESALKIQIVQLNYLLTFDDYVNLSILSTIEIN